MKVFVTKWKNFCIKNIQEKNNTESSDNGPNRVGDSHPLAWGWKQI
jgi:hypothetical protein